MPPNQEERPGVGTWVPDQVTRASLAAGVEACRGCELYRDATHGVPGEGSLEATVMVVGEQPGDQEDRQGKPFVGPAGRLLEKALDSAGVDPSSVYLTNAVKHFRWDPGRAGKRIHKGPSRVHIAACQPWLIAELDLVRPRGVVLLGSTAGTAVYGPTFRVGTARGHELTWPEGYGAVWSPEWALATTHPSAVLRSRQRHDDLAALVKDLGLVPTLLGR